MDRLQPKLLLLVGLAALVFALVGATVALVLSPSSSNDGGGGTGSLKSLTLQPSDLPPQFVVADEKHYSREEMLAQLPAESQVAEAGLQEAAHVAYRLSGQVPMTVDVFVYSYADEASAKAAHAYLRNSDWNQVFFRAMKKSDFYSMDLNGNLAQGMGEDAVSMTGKVASDANSSTSVALYMMQNGTARAEVLMTNLSPLIDEPETVARNQYLRLERAETLSAP